MYRALFGRVGACKGCVCTSQGYTLRAECSTEPMTNNESLQVTHRHQSAKKFSTHNTHTHTAVPYMFTCWDQSIIHPTKIHICHLIKIQFLIIKDMLTRALTVKTNTLMQSTAHIYIISRGNQVAWLWFLWKLSRLMIATLTWKEIHTRICRTQTFAQQLGCKEFVVLMLPMTTKCRQL